MNPQRIQLRRTKGWRKPEGAIIVARPSRWGNPFRVVADEIIADTHGNDWMSTNPHQAAVDLFKRHIGPMGSYEPNDIDEWLAPLVGHDLACWCPLDQPCHADVLLELANAQKAPAP